MKATSKVVNFLTSNAHSISDDFNSKTKNRPNSSSALGDITQHGIPDSTKAPTPAMLATTTPTVCHTLELAATCPEPPRLWLRLQPCCLTLLLAKSANKLTQLQFNL